MMRVDHPSVGRIRSLTQSEEAAVRLYLAEEVDGSYDNPTLFREWWDACKSEAESTGLDPMTVRDATWTWAKHFALSCWTPEEFIY